MADTTEARLAVLERDVTRLTAVQTSQVDVMNIVVQDVRLLRNEVAEISHAIVRLADTIDGKFDVVGARLDTVGASLDAIIERLSSPRG